MISQNKKYHNSFNYLNIIIYSLPIFFIVYHVTIKHKAINDPTYDEDKIKKVILEDEIYLHIYSVFKKSENFYMYTITLINDLTIRSSEDYVDKTPYIIGSILLDEGVRLMSNIVYTDHINIKIGKKVKVIFKKYNADLVVPCFTLI